LLHLSEDRIQSGHGRIPMMRTALLALTATIGLSGAGSAMAAPDGTARAAALEALALKADLPAARPALPSLLTDPDAERPGPGDEAQAGVQDKGDGSGKGKGNGEAKKLAKAEKELAKELAKAEKQKAHADAATAEAALAANEAENDASNAAEKKRDKAAKDKTKKTKPPHPPKGGG
jgi:hypothetical protein